MLQQAVNLLRRPRLGPALTLGLHVLALSAFINGFLLTRVHLPQRAVSPTPTAVPYDRIVWLMIDALRYDFVVQDGRYSCSGRGPCHQGHMPFLSDLSRRQAAARTFMFVADAPTTTTQRLKSLATGGLPSFFDISTSFTAGAVPDDNLVDQMAAAGKQLAFLGDTTWQQLFPRAWAWSRPFPCFNVKDLHTVDDGVWRHLLPALRNHSSWDGLLVAHYLGVDHCGHAHGVSTQQMANKLRQMDSHVEQVVAELVAGAAPDGPYARTLLLVTGDHGQTLGGDHGGGSPEEVDSALVAVDIAALRALQGTPGGGGAAAEHAIHHAALAGSGSGLANPAACRAGCTCGVEGNQCVPDLPQMDLVPTLAAMAGVPTPFGNLGKLNAEMWQLAAPRLAAEAGQARSGQQAVWEASLLEALMGNARQVHTYLNTYAATPGTRFSRSALNALNAQFAALSAAPAASELLELEAAVARCYAFLEAAAGVAREQWTQFREVPMALGLTLFAATLALQAAAAFGGCGGLVARWRQGSRLWVPTFRAFLVVLVSAHALGIFSFFYLLSEGMAVCYLVAAACAALGVATGRAAWAAGQRVRAVAGLAVVSLRCTAVMALVGLAHHTGQGFWTRLTVHDAQPGQDVERGLQGKLAVMLNFASQVLSRVGTDRLSSAVRSVAQHSALCTLPILALLLATHRLQRGANGGGGLSVLQRLLLLAAFASAAGYLQLEDAGRQRLLSPNVSLGQLLRQHLAPLLPPGIASRAQLAAAVVSPHVGGLAALLSELPLRTLLPHATYALCGAAAAVWSLRVATRQAGGTAAAATAAAQVLLALVVQVSDRRTPLILLLGLLLLVAFTRLCARRAELLSGGGGGRDGVAGEAAALTSLVAAQLFYVTGHLCEFAGLQYTAGFVGSDDFHLWRSSSLMALNTFGPTLLGLLALPAVVQHVQLAANQADQTVEGTAAASEVAHASNTSMQQTAVVAGSESVSVPAASRGQLLDPVGGSLARTLLVAGLVRSAAAFCAALSAGLQRRHLYAWALFAPKFAFEAFFLLLADLALLLISLLG